MISAVNMAGKVYIIGAGPGDAGLITVKGLEALRGAQCVVYDRLVNDSLVAAAAPGAELVYAGKRTGEHAMPQDDINRLLVERARAGKVVARLKGGDPLLFGRGAEEADALRDAGIDFEIIPGVTAALGAAAYAGIPLTDRRVSSSVTFVTGREGEGGSPGVNWQALARSAGTIVVYMGRGELAGVVARLREGGLATDTPVAMVENATLPRQRVLLATLGEIAEKAEAAGFEPPCVTVIGAIAARYPSLAWFEKRPLSGKRVCITRPEGAEESLAGALEALGAEVIRFPTIEIAAADAESLREGLALVAEADWLVLTSVPGVETFAGALSDASLDMRALGGTRVAAVGTATAAALAARGVRADLVPEKFTGDELLRAALDASEAGETFLLWHAAGARETLADGLRRDGRRVVEVAAYEAVKPRDVDEAAVAELAANPPSAVLFSSGSTARNFAEILGPEALGRVASASKLISIGPVTSETLRSLGLAVTAEAAVHTGEGLLEATVGALTRDGG